MKLFTNLFAVAVMCTLAFVSVGCTGAKVDEVKDKAAAAGDAAKEAGDKAVEAGKEAIEAGKDAVDAGVEAVKDAVDGNE